MNERIRQEARRRGVKLYEVAYLYGCNDGNFSRKLRRELPDDERDKILRIIDQIAKERGCVDEQQ